MVAGQSLVKDALVLEIQVGLVGTTPDAVVSVQTQYFTTQPPLESANVIEP